MAQLSIIYVKRIIEILEELGVSPEKLLSYALILSHSYASPKSRVDIEIVSDLFNMAENDLDNPLIGVACSRKFRIPSYTKMGNILAFCQDLEEASLTNCRYAPLVHTVGKPEFVKQGENGSQTDQIVFNPTFPERYFTRYRHVLEYVMTNYVTSIDWLAWGFGKGVLKVSLGHEAAIDPGQYEELLDCDVEFSMPYYSVHFRPGIINEPLPTADPSKYSLIKAQQEKILASFHAQNDITFRVEHAIRSTIIHERPTIGKTAETLGISERSLRRFLQAQNSSFKEILETVKMDLCLIMMGRGQKLASIGIDLWYSDQAAFTRAFKRWFGMSPRKYQASRMDSDNHSAALGAK